jgi:hypothetical protein
MAKKSEARVIETPIPKERTLDEFKASEIKRFQEEFPTFMAGFPGMELVPVVTVRDDKITSTIEVRFK